MGFFDDLLANWPPPMSDEDRAECTAQVVEDYFQLLKHIYKTLQRTDKPAAVVVDEDSPFLIKVGSEEFCLDEFVCHDDEVNTGRRMEIDALCADGVSDEDVQRLLNEKIEAEWYGEAERGHVNMKYCCANIFDDFEFHDAWFALKHADDRELTLSAEHVNIHASAEENPHGRDMELDTAAITLHGFRVTSYATGGQWTRNEKNELVATAPQTVLMGEAGERRLLDALRSGVTVHEFGVHEEGGCYLEGGGTDPWFHARLTFDAARIRWDGWKGAAWYADIKNF